MVDRINFLIKETKGLSYKHLINIIIGMVLLAVAIILGQKQLHRYYVKKAAFMQTEIQRIQKSQEELLRKKPKRASFTAQEYVANAMRGSTNWSGFLLDLSKALPDGLWLTKITSAEGGKFLIEGRCYRPETVPKFIGQLKLLSMVQTIGNPSTSKADSEISSLLAFKLTVILKSPKEGS